MSEHGSLTVLKGLTPVPRSARRSRADTLRLTSADVRAWLKPPFQRPLTINKKVEELVLFLKANGGVLDGFLTLGVLDGDTYLLDGQHRIAAFGMSELPELYTDVRVMEFDSMEEMAQEFAKVNDHLVPMRPDDNLRAHAVGNPALQLLLTKCPFIGFGAVARRAGGRAPILSMSVVLRMWHAAQNETPAGSKGAVDLGKALTPEAAAALAEFLTVAYKAWGRDAEYAALWGTLNLTLVAWLWRRTVVAKYRPATTALTREEFSRGCLALSASTAYLDWLTGRKLGDRDRSPAYQRICQTIRARLADDGRSGLLRLPDPSWSTAGGARKSPA